MNKNVSLTIRNLRENLVKFVNCGEYSITKELHAEINGITSALDSLKLDYMFLSNSRSWRNQFNQDALKMDQAAILNLLEKGEVMLKELIMHLGKQLALNLQENQIRKIHFIAKEKLRFYLKSIHPFSHGAYVRLSNYTMDSGLKDRYASIKNELNARTQEPQEPLKAWIDWTDKTFPEQPGFKTPDWRDHTYGLRHDDETEIRRHANKSSCTNKNESGNYFMHTNRYNFTPQPPQTPTMQLQRENTAGSVMEIIDDQPEPLYNNHYNHSPSKSRLVSSQSVREIKRNGANSVLSTAETINNQINNNNKNQINSSNNNLYNNSNRNSALSIHEQSRNATQMSMRAPSTLARNDTVMSIRAPASSYGTVETVYSTSNNAHTTNWRKHAMEAGINLNVPGKSEHQYRYTKPQKVNYKNFVLNPPQDTRLLKRPFLLADYDAITTEYRQRFMFPDKNKIDKFPWIKQL